MDPQIEEIKSKIDLTALIGARVKLTRAGRNLKGLCPFHGEQTPSFIVSPERGTWHCFGCGKHGDAFTFLEEYESMTFPEALEQLAKQTGVELKRTHQPNEQHAQAKQRLYDLHHLAAEFYHYLLMQHPLGQEARDYLKGRGITSSTAKTYQLGFAPNSWRSLSEYLLKKGYSAKEVAAVGLTSSNDRGKEYDRFRNRLVFPVADPLGRIVGFSGRSLGSDDKGPKYLNTAESDLFHKGRLLFGLTQAREAIRKNNRIIFVEGNVDVLAAHQAGTAEVVAPLGTALTEEQVALAKRYTQTILLSFDADNAGQQATMRAIELLKEQQLDIRVVTLLEGKDPDECIATNPAAWHTSVAEAKEVFDYYLHWAAKNFNLQTEKGKREASALLLPLLKANDNPVARAFLVQKAANVLAVDEEVLQHELGLGRPTRRLASPPAVSARSKSIRPREQLVAEYLLSTILTAPAEELSTIDVAAELNELNPQALSLEVYQRICQTIRTVYQDHHALDLKAIMAQLNPDDLPTFDVLSLTDPGNMEGAVDYLSLIRHAIKELNQLYVRQQLSQVSLALKQAEALGNDEVVTLNQQFAQLTMQLVQMEKR